MKKRILFVDDEPLVLAGLRHRLRRQRNKWESFFVGGGHEALELLAAQPIDVIVTDMRMPRMDGAALLERVQADHPEVVRIVLSGYAELESALRAVPVAHQFLTKPCEAGVLENVVERACNLQALISDEAVRRTVGKIEKLPALPRVYSQLMTALSDENVTIDKVAKILKQDMALCAKLLQVVNSAFFRLSRSISTVEQAVTYLGFDTVKQLALAVEVFAGNKGQPGVQGMSLEELQHHSLFTASIASRLFDDPKRNEDAFVAALLHDIGKLLLVMELPDQVEQVVTSMRADGEPMYVVEERLWGVTHAEIGAYLLGLWGLPYPIVEAVANHHCPKRVPQGEFDMLAAVHVADTLANETRRPDTGMDGPVWEVDRAYLARFGQEEKLDGWRAMAQEQAEHLAS